MTVFISCWLIGRIAAHAQADRPAAPRYPGSFIPTAPMKVARACHTATALSDGTVLIVGGYGNNLVTHATAEIYDPLAGSFSPAGSMRVPREGHAATLLNDGTVLITGGGVAAYNSVDSGAELYDPATRSFTLTAGQMHAARANHTATLLPDGTVLIAGGLDSAGHALAKAELYAPISQTFTPVSHMRGGRANHTATLLDDGRVLLAGGSRRSEIYDPVTKSFGKTVFKLRTIHSQAAAALLANGEVLLAGGASIPTTTMFSQSLAYTDLYGALPAAAKGPRLITSRYGATATRLLSGDVLIVGGIHTNQKGYPDFQEGSLYETEGFSAADGSISQGPSMAIARDCHTATLLSNGDVLIAGGETSSLKSSTAQRSAELFVP